MIQDLSVVNVCIVEPGRVNEDYASIWIGGMADNYVLDCRSARYKIMADFDYPSTHDEIDELSDVLAESNVLVIRITYGAFPHSSWSDYARRVCKLCGKVCHFNWWYWRPLTESLRHSP